MGCPEALEAALHGNGGAKASACIVLLLSCSCTSTADVKAQAKVSFDVGCPEELGFPKIRGTFACAA